MSLTMLDDVARGLNPQRGLCAVIAIKERSRSKMRLAQALTPTARIQLVRSMLSAVLSAATEARTVRQVIVLSPERDTVSPQIPVLVDSGDGLNSALTRARHALHKFGCREVVILPADLPTVCAADIDALVHAGRSAGVSIAPDAADAGTNALFLTSAHPFRFQFGADSKRLHVQEAQRMALSPQVLRLPGLEFDVDLPIDLQRLEEQRWLARRQA
jgi:2-phospho-L-lactate guanylyltransferase